MCRSEDLTSFKLYCVVGQPFRINSKTLFPDETMIVPQVYVCLIFCIQHQDVAKRVYYYIFIYTYTCIEFVKKMAQNNLRRRAPRPNLSPAFLSGSKLPGHAPVGACVLTCGVLWQLSWASDYLRVDSRFQQSCHHSFDASTLSFKGTFQTDGDFRVELLVKVTSGPETIAGRDVQKCVLIFAVKPKLVYGNVGQPMNLIPNQLCYLEPLVTSLVDTHILKGQLPIAFTVRIDDGAYF